MPSDFEYDVSDGLERFQGAVRGEMVSASSWAPRAPRSMLGKLTVRAPVYALLSAFAAAAFSGSSVEIHHRKASMASLAPAADVTPASEPAHRARPTVRAPALRDVVADDTSDGELLRPKAPAPAPKNPRGDVRAEAAHEDLTMETADIARLRSVSQSDPARGLALAQDGARKFPQGFFSQEREAIAIRALVRLGRVREARARAEHFLSAYPRGPAAESIRASVGLSPP